MAEGKPVAKAFRLDVSHHYFHGKEAELATELVS
jgi:hypothetical protein